MAERSSEGRENDSFKEARELVESLELGETPDGKILDKKPTLTSVPPEAQRIYDVAASYRGVVESAYGSDIAETVDGELDALEAVTTIGYAVENNPDHQLSREQHDMLAAAEAHSVALETATSLSEQQNATLAILNQSQQTADVVSQLAHERYDLYRAATDPEERTRLGGEMRELKEYTDIIENNDGVADVSSIENAVTSYHSGGEDQDLSGKASVETKTNVYFGKYVQEIIAKVTPAEEQSGIMTDEEMTAAKKVHQEIIGSTGNKPAPEQEQAVEAARHSVEQALNAELFDDIVKLGKNRTRLNTDILIGGPGYKHVGDNPSQNYKELAIPQDLENRFYKGSYDWRQELNEVAMFSDVTEGESPKVVRNNLTGQDEPTVRFRYQFKYGTSASTRGGDELPPYQEFSGGRGGQHVLAGLDLPKSVADQLQKQAIENPQNIRTLVEKLFLENSNGKVNGEDWRQGGAVKHPIRPPYEQLPKDWTLAVVTGAEDARASDYSVERVATR